MRKVLKTCCLLALMAFVSVVAWLVLNLNSRKTCDTVILRGQGWSSVIKDMEGCGSGGFTAKLLNKISYLHWFPSPRPGRLYCNGSLLGCLIRVTKTRITAIDLEPGITAWQAGTRIAVALGVPDYIVWDMLTDAFLAEQAGIPSTCHRCLTPFEGFLGPGLYRLDSGLGPGAVIRIMVRRGMHAIKRIKPQSMSIHTFVILASIVQKEGARPSDMAKIARVFLNRLRRHMPLQSDPTMVYAPYGFGLVPSPTLRRDAGNPYNTYAHRGLPPSPICLPGRKALYAVAHPYTGPDSDKLLYFVAKGNGTHKFSKTFKEHKQGIKRYLRSKHAHSD